MANFNPQPVDLANSRAAQFAAKVLVADPFTASNLASWIEIENSTAEAWGGFYVYQGVVSQSIRGILFIATGAASSEVIIASMPISSATKNSYSMYVPIPIASGTRVSIAASCSAALTLTAQVIGVKSSAFDAEPAFTVLESGPYDLENNAATYGKGKSVDPGSTVDTKGGYTEISVSGTNAANNVIQGDSLAQTYDWFGVLSHDNYNNSQSNINKLVDVATGEVSSEVIFMPDMYERRNSNESQSNGVIWDPGGQTSGTRISARAQADDADAVDRLGTVILFGLRTV